MMPPVVTPLKRRDPHHIAKDFQKLDHVRVSFETD